VRPGKKGCGREKAKNGLGFRFRAREEKIKKRAGKKGCERSTTAAAAAAALLLLRWW